RVERSGRIEHRPEGLSGGEHQRPAVVLWRALAPYVMLADEPSGNMDYHNAEILHDVFAELARDMEIGIVVVTHNRALAEKADRILTLADGRLSESAEYEGVR